MYVVENIFLDFSSGDSIKCVWVYQSGIGFIPFAGIDGVWVFRSVLSASINAAFRLRPYESPYNSSG
jgi:hypothetical protein